MIIIFKRGTLIVSLLLCLCMFYLYWQGDLGFSSVSKPKTNQVTSQQLTTSPKNNETSTTVKFGNNNTKSLNQDTFIFDVFGDSKILPGKENWRGNMVLKKAIAQINRDNPALVFYLGDGVDKGGPQSNLVEFRNYLSNLRTAWYPVIGNHELVRGGDPTGQDKNGEINFQKVFADKLLLAGRSYYSFDHNGSHFIVLDTAWQGSTGSNGNKLAPGSAQWNWLVQDLTRAHSRCNHIFIFGHEPPVSPFRAGGPDTISNLPIGYGSSWQNPRAAMEFIKLVEKYHVDAVFSGHIHLYNRLNINGIPYFITAGAGANLYAPPGQGGYYHYLRCYIKGDSVSYEVVKLEQ